MPRGGDSPGPGTDAQGRPVVDPTQNVLDLVTAAIQRQDDLRETEARHTREIATLRHQYEGELRRSETDRINAIRTVDVAAVQRAAEVASVTAETLRSNVSATASAAAAALASALEPILKSIADLQRAQYETQGGKAQTNETRLNYGALLGGASVLLVLVFGVIGLLVGTR